MSASASRTHADLWNAALSRSMKGFERTAASGMLRTKSANLAPLTLPRRSWKWTTPSVPTAAMTGAPDARYAICERVDGDWRIALVTVPYDPTRMIALARANGAEDWVAALATGWSEV